MDLSDEQLDVSSFTCDEETLRVFDSFLQEQEGSAHQTVDNTTNEVMEDQMGYGDFPLAPSSDPFPQVQSALQIGISQTSFEPRVNEAQYITQ